MNPVVIALASNERYFPGLYCAVASAMRYVTAERPVDLRVLDGGISQASKNMLSRLAAKFGETIRLEFVAVDDSVFRGTMLGPGKSHMTYCRILLPHLLDVPRLIYLDCDVLVFRDLSQLFDLQIRHESAIAAVRDSETVTLGDDSQLVAVEIGASPFEPYFNSGVVLMDLDKLRALNFTERAFEFCRIWKGKHRFNDQSAINFVLHHQIDELPEHWNRASWRFDEQDDNDLGCVLHYTNSAPWIGATPGPAQELFDRFAAEVSLPIDRGTDDFKRSRRQRLCRSALAPFRALAFPAASLFSGMVGRRDKATAYKNAARYWADYVRNASRRHRIYRRRAAQIRQTKFASAASATPV